MPGHTGDRASSLRRLKSNIEERYPNITVRDISYHDLECYWLRAECKGMSFNITHELFEDGILESVFGNDNHSVS